ncbi:hypothetical protein [Vibrio mediterranei]|uniref:hypothetical protein n=1 Tax=Vibrio mediterranei TaxID=689 RepID=UPI0040679A89
MTKTTTPGFRLIAKRNCSKSDHEFCPECAGALKVMAEADSLKLQAFGKFLVSIAWVAVVCYSLVNSTVIELMEVIFDK